VVFDGVEAAENAIKEVQAFPLFNKPMVLAFARTRSDATVKREAGLESREFEAHKRRRLAEKGWLALSFVFILVVVFRELMGRGSCRAETGSAGTGKPETSSGCAGG